MATRGGDDTDRLKAALEALCPGKGAGDLLGDSVPDDGGLRWQKLEILPLPGLDLIINTIKPPLQAVGTLLQIISGLVELLANILIGLPDPLRALIMAAYKAIKAIVDVLLDAGAFFYFDAPDVRSIKATAASMGFPTHPNKTFIAGKTDDPPPPTVPDSYLRWAHHFGKSFDDPGDENRPRLHDGTPIEAVFIVAAAPSLEALRTLIYLLGKLFNIQAFIDAWEKFLGGPDPRRDRGRLDSVAPDWYASRLVDLLPALRKLEKLPKLLESLLKGGDNLSELLRALAKALEDKAKLLLELAEAIQAVIDLLDALQSAGLHYLAVSTDEGVEALKKAFMDAEQRPPGGYVAGICLMAPPLEPETAAAYWELLGLAGAFEFAEDAYEAVESGELAEAITDFIEDLPGEIEDALGRAKEEIVEAANKNRTDLAHDADDATAEGFDIGDQLRQIASDHEKARRRGTRSLAMAFGAPIPPPEDDE